MRLIDSGIVREVDEPSLEDVTVLLDEQIVLEAEELVLAAEGAHVDEGAVVELLERRSALLAGVLQLGATLARELGDGVDELRADRLDEERGEQLEGEKEPAQGVGEGEGLGGEG